jgi:penicillin-binding protein 1A
MPTASTNLGICFPRLDLGSKGGWEKFVQVIRFLPLACSVIESKTLQPKFTFHMLDRRESFVGLSGNAICYPADDRELEAACRLVVHVEDRRFFSHHGVDPLAIIRSLIKNLSARRIVQGGSTITQQLIRNTFLTSDHSFTRKFLEIFLAWRMERYYSKKDILSLYAQLVYLGRGIRGFAAASKAIYRRPISALDHEQLCGLVGLLRRPSATHPLKSAASYLDRQAFLIGLTHEQKRITTKERAQIRRSLPLPNPINVAGFRKGRWTTTAETTVKSLLGEYAVSNISRVGLTIDQSLQRTVDSVLKDISLEAEISRMAGVMMDNSTGDILVESAWEKGLESAYSPTFNGRIQPGSTFKTFGYLAALESGFTPDMLLESRPFESSFVKNGNGSYWCVRNYANKYRGTVPLIEAFQCSDNSAFARLTEMIPSAALGATYQRFGLCPEDDVTPAIVLGGTTRGVSLLSLISAYATIARGGVRVRPRFVRFVQYSDGSFLRIPVVQQDTLVIYDNSILLALRAALKRAGEVISSARFSGKTGTTKKGSLFVGYNQEVSLAIWIGYRTVQSEHRNKGVTSIDAIERIVQKLLGYRQDLFSI